MINKQDLPEITSSKLYLDSKKSQVDQAGLISEIAFGPVKSYKCSCGNLNSKVIHENQRCIKCKVECIDNASRYTRFAKISLPFPILKKLERQKLLKFVKRKNAHILDPVQSDRLTTTSFYIQYIKDTDKLELVTDYDAGNCIPLVITGLFTLYLGLYIAQVYFTSKSAEELLSNFFFDLLVVPPNTRMSILVEKDSKMTMITHELDNIYIKILRLKHYCTKFDTYQQIREYTDMIIQSLDNKIGIPITDDILITFDQLTSKITYYCDDVYSHITGTLSGKTGLIRDQFLGRSIDFSSRAVIVPDPTLKAHEIIIPRKIFLKLWLIEYYRYLRTMLKDEWATLQTAKILSSVTKTENSYTNELEYVDEFIEYFFRESDYRQRIVLVNRQPTLWRYGMPGVIVSGITEENVIKISPISTQPLNADFDGDTYALYRLHDRGAIQEISQNAYTLNNIQYDHNTAYLNTLSMESKYSFVLLTYSKINNDLEYITIDSLKSLPIYEEPELNKLVLFNKKRYSYGVCLLNKWCGFDNIILTKESSSDDLSKEIHKDSLSNEDYFNRINKVNQLLSWLVSTHSKETLTLPFNEAITIVHSARENHLLQHLPSNPHIGHQVHQTFVNDAYKNIPEEFKLAKLAKSKYNKVQFSRSLVSIGYIADDRNIISPEPVTTALLSGLTEEEFFRTSYGSRKGIVDKHDATPRSGYLERSLVLNLSPIEIAEEDCNSTHGFMIKIQDIRHSKSLKNRYYSNNTGWVLFDGGAEHVGNSYSFRSPITCASPNFKICQKCFGRYEQRSKFVGILAGQYIAERLTQLSMRSFHTSGSATLPVNNNIETFIKNHLVEIVNYDDHCNLIFDIKVDNHTYQEFKKVEGFVKTANYDNILSYSNTGEVDNSDITKVIQDINNLLNTDKNPNLAETYSSFITNTLSVGDIYSVYCEIVLANLFVNKDNVVLRYALANSADPKDWVEYKKYSIREVHSILSSTLSLLFQPNHKTIKNLYRKLQTGTVDDVSIFERIWANKL
jgi:hypothetical protein